MANSKDSMTDKMSKHSTKTPQSDEEIADILLIDRDLKKPDAEAEKVDEIVYELVVEESKKSDSNDDVLEINEDEITEKIAQLYRRHDAMKQQLDKAIIKTDRLTRQIENLKKSGQTSVISYVALIIAGLSLIIAAVAVVVGNSMQKDVAEMPAASANNIKQETPQKTPNLDETAKTDSEQLDATINSLLTESTDAADENEIIVTDNLNDDAVVETTVDKELPIAIPKTSKKQSSETVVTEEHKKTPETKTEAKKEEPTQDTVKPETEQASENKTSTTKKEVAPVVAKQNKDGRLASTSPTATTTAKKTSTAKQQSTEDAKEDGSQKKSNTSETEKLWVVGLGSFKNEASAKKKASEYRLSGVPVSVLQVKVAGQTWHRISTKTFKTRKEAAEYATHVKQKLNIGSVLVTKTN